MTQIYYAERRNILLRHLRRTIGSVTELLVERFVHKLLRAIPTI